MLVSHNLSELISFQFLIGKISRNNASPSTIAVTFQFLIGKISLKKSKRTSRYQSQFQFLIGKISLNTLVEETDSQAFVSIPHR